MSRDECRRIVRRSIPATWALLLGLLMLGPALGPGYVLTYDMVWVPDLALRSDFLGVGSALPRAVPSDAVIAVMDEVIPGMLLQKLVLLSGLVGGGAGVDRLMATTSLPARMAAVSFYVWNPFVVERLVIGHWPVLIAYAALPWVVVRARSLRIGDAVPGSLFVLVTIASLSASAGVMTAVALIAFGWGRGCRLRLLGIVVAANAPWAAAGLLHAGAATSDPGGAARFALQGEGWLPAPLTALGMGGIWNADVVPVTREGALGLVALVVLMGLAAAGLSSWRSVVGLRDQLAFLSCWCVGLVLAVLTWLVPESFAWVARAVPGGGLLRDGSRLLGLCGPLLAMLVGHGVERVGRTVLALTREHAQSVFIASMLTLAPLALMPDAGWGSAGELQAVDYPDSYGQVRTMVPDDTRVLLLPFTSYRAPSWNHEQKVLDPLGRYLKPNFAASDELVVSGEVLAGEDPLGSEVRAALEQPTADARAKALTDLGIGTIVTELDAPGTSPDVKGRSLGTTADHRVVALDGHQDRETPPFWATVMGIAWAVWVGLLGCSLLVPMLRVRRARRR